MTQEKKMNEEELLEWFEEAINGHAFLQISHPHLACTPTEKDTQAYNQIMALIKKPRVTEEFIKDWQEAIEENATVYKSGQVNIMRGNLVQMLIEAGVEVGGK